MNIDINELKKRLDFSTEFTPNTDEVSGNYFCDLHHCKIIIFDTGTIIFKGSLHKMWNSLCVADSVYSKGFNGNDFNYLELQKVLEYLRTVFDCEFKDMLIQGMELGVNLNTPFNPRLFVKGLLYHKKVSFEHRFNKNFAQCEHSQYIIKIYSKSYQYALDDDILRVEVKFLKSIQLEPFGIKTVEDISAISLQKAMNHVIAIFDEVVYYDYTIQEKEVPEPTRQLLDKYKKDIYFVETLNNRQRFNHKKKLKNIIFNYSLRLKYQIHSLILEKKELLYT